MVFYSVDIYKSKQGTILIIPDAFNKKGLLQATDVFEKLEDISQVNVLGQLVKECFQISQASPVVEYGKDREPTYQKATGIKSWAKFFREHIYVSGVWKLQQGYRFSPLKKRRGGYVGEKGDPEVEIGEDSSDEEIGAAVLKAFSYLE